MTTSRNTSGGAILIPTERIEQSILFIRGERVMLDSELAVLYGVQTKVLNQAVKRNASRFPADFMFRLTSAEADELRRLRSQIVTLKRGEHRKYLPNAFTEHGALMLANILNSERAELTSVMVVRAFVRLRQMLASNADLSRKMAALEEKYDSQFREVFDAIRQLMSPPRRTKREIGFHVRAEGPKAKAQRR